MSNLLCWSSLTSLRYEQDNTEKSIKMTELNLSGSGTYMVCLMPAAVWKITVWINRGDVVAEVMHGMTSIVPLGTPADNPENSFTFWAT